MAGSSLLALLDDIATMLDDVAALSKVAAKKTAGVLGDDLALNAQQVSGVQAERELPVVWAVAKGSLLNKLILVPAALLISAFLPVMITVLLVIGGLFLCFEGFEKVVEKFFHQKHAGGEELLTNKTLSESEITALENKKIKGAIRTDFVLSAEIIVIVLGSVQSASFETQVAVVSGLAILFTVGVYGLVAGIVKLDDLGLYLLRQSIVAPAQKSISTSMQRFFGRSLLAIAPKLMKSLALIGTIAMFLVGGGIITHSIGPVHHVVEFILSLLTSAIGDNLQWFWAIAIDGFVGVIAGAIVLAFIAVISSVKAKFSGQQA